MANQFLIKETMDAMRNLSTTEIDGLKGNNPIYAGIELLGYYQKGDTPVPITYFKSPDTLVSGLDNGGSIIELGDLILVHDFVNSIDLAYFGAYSQDKDGGEIANKAINYLSSNGVGEIIISKHLYVSTTLMTKPNINLIFKSNARIVLRSNVNAIDLNHSVIIDSPFVDVSGVTNFSQSALYCSGDKRIKTRLQRTLITNAIFYNNEVNPSGNGLKLYSGINNNDAVSFLQIENLHIHGFENGILIHQDNNPNAWVTGNTFVNVMLSANKKHVNIQGSDGNNFIGMQIQPFSNYTERQIFCSGSFNMFSNILMWDVTNITTIEFTESSRFNTVHLTGGGSPRTLIDIGVYNTIIFNGSQQSIINNKLLGSSVRNAVINNYLAYAEERNIVTASVTPTAYSINNAFKTKGLVRWEGDLVNNAISIEIEFPVIVNNVQALGVDFNPNYTPKNVVLEVFNSVSNTWIIWCSYNKNIASSICTNKYLNLSTHANNVKKIRLTFSKPNNDVLKRVELIYLWMITSDSEGYNFYNRDMLGSASINSKGLVKQSVNVLNSNFSDLDKISLSAATDLASCVALTNDLKDKYNQASEFLNDLKKLFNAKLNADRESGQQLI